MTTQELTREVVELKTWRGGVDEKMRDHRLRLDDIEKDVKEQGRLLQSIDKLAMGLTRLDEKMGDLSCKLDNFNGRITTIELKPAKKWEQVGMEIIKYIVLTGLGFLAAMLLKGV